MKEKTKILISGSYGTGNTGDEIILHCILEQLKEFDVTVLSQGPEYTQKHFKNIRVIPQTPSWGIKKLVKDVLCLKVSELKKRFIFLKELIRADYFFLGGGGLLAELVPRVLRYYCHQLILAKFFGCKPIVLTIGIGPLKTNPGKIFLKYVMNNIPSLISVRDEVSRDLLFQIGVTKKVVTVPDPAFLYEVSSPNPAEAYVVINFYRTFDDPQLWPGMSHRRETLMETLEKIIEYIALHYKYKVVLLPFGSTNDQKFSESTLNDIMQRSPHLASYLTIYKSDSYEGITKTLTSARWSITMRFHAGLISLANQKPSICIDQQFKSERLLTEMKLLQLLIPLPDGYHKNGNDDVGYENLKQKVDDVEKNYLKIQEEIKFYNKNAKTELQSFWDNLKIMLRSK